MQRLLWISLLLVVSTSNGCMVIDELDKAAAMMPEKEQSQDEGKDGAVASATSGGAKENALLRQSKQWWDRATSLSPTGLESSIVSCRLRGETQFMSKDNCLSRGGKPRSVSG